MRLLRVCVAAIAALGAFTTLAVVDPAPAHACCQDGRDDRCNDNDDYPVVHKTDAIMICVHRDAWSQHAAQIRPLFDYPDRAIAQLADDFAFHPVRPAGTRFVVQAHDMGGVAWTPSDFGPGMALPADAFWNDGAYWAYLLILHEFVNQWTGLVTGGWPTDWWADHRSPFPNSVDWHVLEELGYTAAAQRHRARWQMGSGEYDPQVLMFDAMFADHGWTPFQVGFRLLREDQVKWGGLRDPPGYTDHTEFVSGNPSKMLNEYVLAYLSLGARGDLTSRAIDNQVGLEPDNWPSERGWTVSVPDAADVGAIADAHCALASAAAAIDAAAAGGADVAQARRALDRGRGNLRKGNYRNVAVAGYPSSCTHCPGECACDAPSGLCVAPWNAAGGGGSGPDAGGDTPDGGGGGGPPDAGGGGSPDAGGGPAPATGDGDVLASCACRAGVRASDVGGIAILIVVAVWFLVRRRY